MLLVGVKSFRCKSDLRPMLKMIFLWIFLFNAFAGFAQTVGDYRTSPDIISQGLYYWSDLATWHRYNGTTWAAPTVLQGYPGQYAVPTVVTLNSGTIILLDLSVHLGSLYSNGEFSTEYSLVNLTIDVELGIGNNSFFAFLSEDGDLIVTGAVDNSGFLSLENIYGITTLVGQFVNQSTGALTSFIEDESQLVFQGGIVNNGIFSVGGATFNTNNQTITGTSPVSFANTVRLENVTVTNNNSAAVSIINTGPATLTGTGAGTWTQGTNSTLNYSGTTITNITLNASNSGNTINYNCESDNQTIYNPSSSTYANLILSGALNQTKTLSANMIVSGNVSIQNQAIFSVNTFTLSVAGNWFNSSINSDPFVEGTQTVTFNGTSTQVISNSGDAQGTEFYNVTFNNTSGTIPQITFSNATVVRNTLAMMSGVVNLNSTTFTVGTAAGSPGSLSHSQTSTAGWFYNGNLTRYFNTGTIAALSNTGFFPMGNVANFRPFFLSATGITTCGTITLNHGSATTVSSVSIDDGNPTATITVQYQGAWTVSSSGVDGGTHDIVAGGTGFGIIGSLNHIRLSRAASVVGTHVTAYAITTSDPRAERSGLTLAELTGGALFLGTTDEINSPLPIELVSFSVAKFSNGVRLKWMTASELNNDFFDIQRSVRGEEFESIFRVAGQGTTKLYTQYEYEDELAPPGNSYYRLKQVDFDGATSFSNVRMVVLDNNKFDVYPTVSENGRFEVLFFTNQPNAIVPIEIISDKGSIVLNQTYQADRTGLLQTSIELNHPPGLYFLSVQFGMGLRKKIILK